MEITTVLAQQTQDWKSYIDPINKFRLDYPSIGFSSVDVTTDSPPFNGTYISLPTEDFTFEVYIVNKSSLPDNIKSASEYAEYEKNNITIPVFGDASIFEDLISVKYPNFNGTTYTAVLYGYDVGGNVIIKKVFVDHIDKIFYFLIRDDITSFEERTSENIMRSVNFFE